MADYENTPQFIVLVGEEVVPASSEGDLQDVLKQYVTSGSRGTVYKLDGDAVNKNGSVEYYPLGFE